MAIARSGSRPIEAPAAAIAPGSREPRGEGIRIANGSGRAAICT